MTTDLYCILPSGNADEFPQLDSELIRRGVAAKYCESRHGSRIYWIPNSELGKLPVDDKGAYLGDDNSGHSIYPLPDVDEYRKFSEFSEWRTIQ